MKILISSLSNKVLGLVCFTGAVVFFFASCSGGPDSGKMPEWLSSYPASSSYYVGIGGSNTGSMAEDREKAAAAARADLAAQISAQVSSELEVSSHAASDGSFNESVERTVNESVDQNLKSVDTVDSWFSPEHGAWVYVRLSKAVWAAIIKDEIASLTLKANTILSPVASGNLTEAENMAALGRARLSLLSSPWGLRVKDEVFGSNGYLIDLVDAEISDRTGSLLVKATANPSEIKYGSELVLSGRIESGSGGSIGAYPLFL
ncbi:MAG: LPP20 family lipoprotein, partial [Spirochaetaceae bacterium]|nr:LPP20 family lipoprotein [Spirochaetaceae bacterium]